MMKIDHIYFKYFDWTYEQAFHCSTLDILVAVSWWNYEYPSADSSQTEFGVVLENEIFIKLGTLSDFYGTYIE